jgi:predicted PurR-regulated permease PerM
MSAPPGPTNSAGTRPVALAALTLAVVAACLVVLWPLLPALTWAVAFAVISWPAERYLVSRFGHAGIVAFVLTLAVGTAVVGAGTLTAFHLVKETVVVAEKAGTGSATEVVRDTAARVPGGDKAMGWVDRAGLDLEQEARNLANQAMGLAAGVAAGSARAAAQLAVALFLLFYLLRDRGLFVAYAKRLLPMSSADADRLLLRAADAVYGNLYANLGTSVVAGVTSGLVFWAVGLPAPVLLGAGIFVLDLLPALGTWLVWVPAAAYLATEERWGGMAVVLAYGVALTVLIDYVLYARLASGRSGMHSAVALVAVIGGLAVFGAAGLVLGPVLAALAGTLFDVWHERRSAPTKELVLPPGS